jgi:hypothetical protein
LLAGGDGREAGAVDGHVEWILAERVAIAACLLYRQ